MSVVYGWMDGNVSLHKKLLVRGTSRYLSNDEHIITHTITPFAESSKYFIYDIFSKSDTKIPT